MYRQGLTRKSLRRNKSELISHFPLKKRHMKRVCGLLEPGANPLHVQLHMYYVHVHTYVHVHVHTYVHTYL
jgi:hypothetical protein